MKYLGKCLQTLLRVIKMIGIYKNNLLVFAYLKLICKLCLEFYIKVLKRSLCFLLTLTAPPPPVAMPPPVGLVPNCPDNYYTWQSRCYHLSTAPFSSWNLANDYCKSYPDSRIFTPKSSTENDFIQTRLGIWEGQYSRVWLEATYAEAESVWRCGRDTCSYLSESFKNSDRIDLHISVRR